LTSEMDGLGSEFLKRQRRFPLLALPADLVNSVAAQLPLIIVANRFGAEFAGLLALTLRIVGAPIGLLGASVLDVFRRRSAASFMERGECRAEYLDTFRVLALGSVLVAIALSWAAELFFVFAFGDAWRMSGTIAVWLMPMFALRFVASPLSYMMYVAQRQHLDLLWQLGLLGVTWASLTLPSSPFSALQAYGVGYSSMYVLYLYLTFRLSLGSRK
jgi:O-antigen/teichoic acid export membrane protein